MFAALALAFSASAIFGTGAASAGSNGPRDATCQNGGENEIDAQGMHERHCFTVETTVQPGTEVPLGTPVHDDVTVTKHEEDQTCAVQETVCATSQPSFSASVTFTLYNGSSCDGGLVDVNPNPETENINFPDDQSSASSSDVVLPAGNYSYLVRFDGSVSFQFDPEGVTEQQQQERTFDFFADGVCEPFRVDQADPGVSTTIHPSNNVNEGTTVFDSATVSGVSAFTPTGTVSFTFYNAWNCGSVQSFLGSFGLDSNGFTQSVSVGAPSAGEYSFLAHYNGDSNYFAQDGVCENLSVNGVTPPPVPPQVVLQPVIIVQPVPQPVAQPQPAQLSPASAVRATGSFTG